MLDLKAIKVRCDLATPGPWKDSQDLSRHPCVVAPSMNSVIARCHGRDGREVSDAEFIAAARADIPALLAEVERLRREVDAYAHWMEKHCGGLR